MQKPYFMIFLTALITTHFFAFGSSALSGAPDEKGREFTRSISERIREEREDTGWAARKKLLLEYGISVTPKNEVSLRDFRGGDDAASRAIEGGKARMVFHLLRRLAGEEAFTRVAAKLGGETPVSSWDDVRGAFEKETGRDLDWFFKQWVDRKGLPDLSVENVTVRRNGSRFEVSLDLFQNGDIYVLDVPVSISSLRGGGKEEFVKIDGEKKHASFLVDDEPSEVAIDKDYDIPRKLTEEETPPLLAKLFVDEKLVIVPPADGAGVYAGAVDAWKQRGAEEKKAADVRDADMKSSSLIVLGAENPVALRLYGKVESGTEALRLTAKKNPWNLDKVVVIVQAQTTAAASGAVQAIVASGDCSSLSIDAQARMTQQTAESDRGMVVELRGDAVALDVSALRTLSDVIEKAAEKKIVYVGEYHDRFAHHNVELQVIKDLHRKDPKIAVGMEMFQRPSQKALDDYISGAIDEREFLKKSEYFKRWSFDYNLYKPILDFARTEKIPVIALNQKSEIVDKVSKGGMDSLSSDEKKETPAQMDFSDSEYRDRLRRVFEQHRNRERDFDFFYQAQILWDETMAESIDAYLQKNPDRRMIVITGSGHQMFGAGIPKRAFRRNGLAYATILNDADVDGGNVADYLIYPQPLEGMMAPRIMVVLNETQGSVTIMDLPEGSVSRKAGIKAGDILLSFDGAPVRDVADIKIALFYKKHGDTVRVKVLRHRFLFGDKEMTFDVKLP